MARAKYQVLVIPYHIEGDAVQYCIFRRSDMGVWQFIAGGGEDEDGSALTSAQREAFEEACIPMDQTFVQLETQCSVSTEHFPKARKVWSETCLVIPEYAFAVKVHSKNLELSREHTTYRWVDYDTARDCLRFDSNIVALWELDNKIKLGLL